MSDDSQPISEFKSRSGVKRIFSAFFYSLDGLRTAWRYEHAFRQEMMIVVPGVIVALMIPVTVLERIALIGVLPARETTPERAEQLRALDRGLMELTRDLNLAYVPTLRPPLVDSELRLNAAISVDDRHLSPAGYSILARWLIEEGGEAGRGLAP